MCGKSHHHGITMSSDPIHEAPLVSKPIVMELDVEAVSAVAVNAPCGSLWHVCLTMDRNYHIFSH